MAATFLASSVQTASGVSASLAFSSKVVASRFYLDVTAAGSIAGDTFDVYLQSSMDGGTVWDDFAKFTQVLGNGGVKQFIASWVRTLAPTTAQRAPRDGSLAAGVEPGPIGNLIRVKWVIVNGGGTHSFTFAVLHEMYRP